MEIGEREVESIHLSGRKFVLFLALFAEIFINRMGRGGSCDNDIIRGSVTLIRTTVLPYNPTANQRQRIKRHQAFSAQNYIACQPASCQSMIFSVAPPYVIRMPLLLQLQVLF